MTKSCSVYLKTLVLSLLLLLTAAEAKSEPLEITPFRTINNNPLSQIYGLPAETSAVLTGSGRWQFNLTQDIASIYSTSESSSEQILLDGELYRWNLSARYGLSNDFEVGLEIPFILQEGGFLDGFINDWHDAFGLSHGGRDSAPKNRLRYQYTKNGRQLLNMTNSSGGIGDISLLGAYRIFEQKTATDHDAVALRAQLKLPSGDTDNLMGSGSVDMTLFLTGSMNRSTEWGMLGVFASAGGMVSSDGSILESQRENLAALGTAGLGWAPTSWIAFKVQCNLNTPLFNSGLSEIGSGSALLTFGGTLKLPDNYLLDIGVGEDIAVSTAPDVNFHIGLAKRF